MLQRLFSAGLIAVAMALVATARPQAAPRPSDGDGDGYEQWSNCQELPDVYDYLPVYLGTDSRGFVDAGRNETMLGQTFRALQYTRDKDFGQWPIRPGRWYGGFLADRWPLRTIDPSRLLAQLRVVAWEIDGTLFPVDPSCVLTYETDDAAYGLFNLWVRFSTAGPHTLKVIYKQVAPFAFIDPFIAASGLDPFGLDGRRVFVTGEEIGDVLDQQFVHSYELVVLKDDGTER